MLHKYIQNNNTQHYSIQNNDTNQHIGIQQNGSNCYNQRKWQSEYDSQHKHCMSSFVMLSVVCWVSYAECRYAKRHYTECHIAQEVGCWSAFKIVISSMSYRLHYKPFLLLYLLPKCTKTKLALWPTHSPESEQSHFFKHASLFILSRWKKL